MLGAIIKWFEGFIDPFKPYPLHQPPSKIFDFYWHFLKQVWPWFVAFLLISFFTTLTELMVFRYIADIVDILAKTKPVDLWRLHSSNFMTMLAVLLIAWPVFNILHALVLQQTINTNVAIKIRWQSHLYVVRQSLSFFANDYAGRVANKVVDTASALRSTIVSLCDTFLYVVVYFGSALYLFFSADFRLVIPLIVWTLAYAATCLYYIPKVSDRAEAASEAKSKLVGQVVDSYNNIQTVKLFANTQREDNNVKDAMRHNVQKWLAQGELLTRLEVCVAILNGLLLTITGALALYLWTKSVISVGAIALTLALTQRILNMSNWVMFQFTGLFENIGTVQNGMETISRPLSVIDVPEAKSINVSKGEVVFEAVTFGYKGADKPIFDGLDLTIKGGEKIGLIGPSGAGKSTLVNLFLRLYDVNNGRIFVDGQDIALVEQESLRHYIGMVTQDTSLLHRSLADNIAYGKPEASLDEIMRAAYQARADEFISGLKDSEGREGLEAFVGERGVKLSGGQRQRIAIARVLLKNAPILVLDEATSALDSEVEAAIQDSLSVLMQGKTVIAIAHRLSTIAHMDRLVVMDEGKIVEMGTHKALIASGGLYARLWHRQTGGFIGDHV